MDFVTRLGVGTLQRKIDFANPTPIYLNAIIMWHEQYLKHAQITYTLYPFISDLAGE